MLGQLRPLGNQRLALVVDASATGVEFGGPAGHVGGQLGREQLVVGDGCLRGHAASPAVSSSGRASRVRTWSKTKASSSSARLRTAA